MTKKTLFQVAKRYKKYVLPPYDVIMDMNGFDAICAFSELFGGEYVYVPSLRTIFGKCIKREILQQYTGENIYELSNDFGFSKRHIRNLVRDSDRKDDSYTY
jgi:Mor family transcriptional regulator